MTLVRPTSLAVVGLLCLASSLVACNPLKGKAERHLVTTEPTPASLEIVSRFLDVSVTVAPSDEVSIDASVYLEVSGTNEDAEREIEGVNVFVLRDGDKLVVRQGEEGKSWSYSGSYSARGTLAVKVPANVPFSVQTASGDVKLAGDFGAVALALSTASGDITVSDVGATSASIRTASGDGTLSFLRTLDRFAWTSASGDVRMNGGALDVSAETASGDVRVSGIEGPISVSTASGDVIVGFAPCASLRAPTTRLRVSTASGDVRLELPSEVAPSGSITTASGDISVPQSMPHEKARRSMKLTGAGAAIECSTASGDVRITN